LEVVGEAVSLIQEGDMDEQIILEEETIADEQALHLAHLGVEITAQPIRGLPTLKEPVCVDPADTVRKAIDEMNRHRVGCVLVEEGGRLVGVFTERDVLGKIAPGGIDIDRTRVAEVMTRDPECLTPDDGVAYALNKMSFGGYRHIPLVDDDGRPVGIVAMRNIVDFIVALFPNQVLNLPPAPGLGVARTREGA
jgi:CBS domain-containing protein